MTDRISDEQIAEILAEPGMIGTVLSVDVLTELRDWRKLGESPEAVRANTAEANRCAMDAGYPGHCTGQAVLCLRCADTSDSDTPAEVELVRLVTRVSRLRLELDVALDEARICRGACEDVVTGSKWLPLADEAAHETTDGFCLAITAAAYEAAQRCRRSGEQ